MTRVFDFATLAIKKRNRECSVRTLREVPVPFIMGNDGPDLWGREREVRGENSRVDRDGWNERRDEVVETGKV